MDANFERAFKLVIGFEGHYTNDPNDPGGETKFGISKKAFPELDIKNLTLDQAKSIYYDHYWKKVGCDVLPFPLDIIVFDTAVNIGTSAARTFLVQIKNRTPEEYLLRRVCFYVDLANSKEWAKKFFRGWINRIVMLYRELTGGNNA